MKTHLLRIRTGDGRERIEFLCIVQAQILKAAGLALCSSAPTRSTTSATPQKVIAVISNGRLFDRSALDRLLAQIASAAQH
jgi:hypothetical protein